MPDKQRRIIELIHSEGRNQSEVAAELGMSQSQVSRSYTAAMERLRIICEKAA
jgi:RNA polymerase sigma factor (sigma-70 family)